MVTMVLDVSSVVLHSSWYDHYLRTVVFAVRGWDERHGLCGDILSFEASLKQVFHLCFVEHLLNVRVLVL